MTDRIVMTAERGQGRGPRSRPGPAVKAGARALLAKHNIRIPGRDLNGGEAIAVLDQLQLPGTYATRLASQRRPLMVLQDEIAIVEADLARRLKDHPGYTRLLTIAGVGPTLAAIFVAELADVGRCARSLGRG